jgi:deoxycytidylate deaminase
MNKGNRPNINEYFLKIASVVAERSTCLRHHVGAVAVRDKHILSTGYKSTFFLLDIMGQRQALRIASNLAAYETN